LTVQKSAYLRGTTEYFMPKRFGATTSLSIVIIPPAIRQQDETTTPYGGSDLEEVVSQGGLP
jgi:hypothetical protein